MLITDHRDAACIDFWRGHHLSDGTLVPLPKPTSPEVYKSLIEDVYLDEAAEKVSSKIHGFLLLNQPSFPLPPPIDLLNMISENISKISHVPHHLLSFHMAFVNNALATSRRMRHQNNLSIPLVDACFFCGLYQDSLVHIFSDCQVVCEARIGFFRDLGLKLSSLSPSLPVVLPPLSLSVSDRSSISSIIPTSSSITTNSSTGSLCAVITHNTNTNCSITNSYITTSTINVTTTSTCFSTRNTTTVQVTHNTAIFLNILVLSLPNLLFLPLSLTTLRELFFRVIT